MLQICSPLGWGQSGNFVGAVAVPLNAPEPGGSTRTCPPWKFQVPSMGSQAWGGAASARVAAQASRTERYDIGCRLLLGRSDISAREPPPCIGGEVKRLEQVYAPARSRRYTAR